MRRLLLVVLAVMALAWCGQARATVLTFSNLGLGNFDDIPTTYGDNVTNDNGGQYAMGAGWTPNVVVDYLSTEAGTGNTVGNLTYWEADYGDLVDVAFNVYPRGTAQVSLIPEPGWEVCLRSFDLGGWRTIDHLNQPVLVLDGNGNLLLNLSGTVKGAGPSHSHYEINLWSSSGFHIRFGDNWDVGIDNIDFYQRPSQPQPVVPEPGTLALLLSTAVPAMCFAIRRRF